MITIAPHSPLEDELTAHLVAATLTASAPDLVAAGPGAEPQPVKEMGHVTEPTQPTETTVRPITLLRGAVLVRHPDAPAIQGEWTLTADATHDGWFTRLDYRDTDGKEGVFVLPPGVPVRVRITNDTSPNGSAA